MRGFRHKTGTPRWTSPFLKRPEQTGTKSSLVLAAGSPNGMSVSSNARPLVQDVSSTEADQAVAKFSFTENVVKPEA
jgi:hypothetical protein